MIDSREPSEIIYKLKSYKELEVKDQFLDVGDYLLPGGYAIERKKGKDLMLSVKDNRLFNQLNNLYQYEHPILAIITNNKWKDFYFTKSRYVHSQYMGILTTLTIRYPKLKVMFFEDDDEFILYIRNLYKKLQDDGHKERPAPKLRKAKSIEEIKENCLAQIDGVGIKMAKKLLKKFKSIRNIADASKKDLMEIEKLGDKTAEKILEVLN